MQLMAYSIYYTLKDQGIGRNIEYIAYNTGITSKQLWKCESLDPNLAIPISIENLLTPVYTLFHLSKQDHDNIISISRHFQERHFSPLTMTSTLVYNNNNNNNDEVYFRTEQDRNYIFQKYIH